MNEYKTHTCNEISLEDVGKKVRIAGWVQTIRDLGGLVFLDIRDMYGITQVVTSGEAKDVDFASHIPIESTVTVYGTVKKRDEETVNPKLKTGLVEIKIEDIKILGKRTKNIPFEINTNQEIREDLRLQYRYLDLRNERLQNNLKLRAQVLQFLRNQMQEQGFLEVQTPILTSSSPEGARDYLVPSRLHPGKFYALPQAPQQFKQLLMVSGIDKYFQIAPCFRDEDARADRAPGEFYQLDMEMSFATQEDVFQVMEPVMYNTFKKFSDKKIAEYPFPRITYKDAMLKYGSDKPDLRNPLYIIDLSDFFKKCTFKPFIDRTVRAIKVEGHMSKGFHEKMLAYAMSIGMQGLGYLEVQEDMSFKGPIDKFIPDDLKKTLIELADLKQNDTIFFIADNEKRATELAGQIRTELGNRLNLIDEDVFQFCWIIDFPMFELDDHDKLAFSHNPFSMPQGGLDALENQNPLEILAYQYDIVCNGIELSSGAVRNHDIQIMLKAFEMAGYTEEEVKTKFGALYTAFQFGAPPHAGIAPGIDRMLMLLSNSDTIREVIAFPLNSKAQDLMMGAPGNVRRDQLRDVHIEIIKK
ncbi:aspartate--tRNA ligase 1 [Clostridium sp. CAG:470]|nr:MAG: aspartate--tRNA ligase [Clostridium sp. 28_17]CDE14902.1 aspartate--tRNA ligase 1 [Clostridium sp. CAG:470]